MLDFMRRNANSWVMIVLFGVMIFVFAINFGPWAGNTSTSVPYAATVNNQAISMPEFRAAYVSQFGRIKQFRPEYSEEQADKDGLKRIVVDQLVTRELLTQLGKKYELKIGPKTLAEEIKLRVFGPDQPFNKDEYVKRVNAYFQSGVSHFEEQVAKELVAQQMADLISSVYVSEKELKENFIEQNTKVAVEFIKVVPEHFASTQKVQKSQIASFAEKNLSQINEYYEENKADYVKDEMVRASHILIKVDTSDSEEIKNQKRARAEEILKSIQSGSDFAKLAKENSDDPGSAKNGGDLDFFTKPMMVEQFSEAAFALDVGQVSDVVESPFGFHIIKTTGKKDATEKSLEDAKLEIAEILLQKDSQRKLAKNFANQALKQLNGKVALKHIKLAGLKNKAQSEEMVISPTDPVADETKTFTKNQSYVSKLGRTSGLMDHIFSLSRENPVSKNIVEANGNFYAFRLKEKENADLSQFENSKDSLKNRAVYPRKRALMQQVVEHLKSNAKIKYNNTLI